MARNSWKTQLQSVAASLGVGGRGKDKRRLMVLWKNGTIVSVWWQLKAYMFKSLKIFPMVLVALFL